MNDQKRRKKDSWSSWSVHVWRRTNDLHGNEDASATTSRHAGKRVGEKKRDDEDEEERTDESLAVLGE